MSRKERREQVQKSKPLEALRALFQTPIELVDPGFYPEEFVLPDSLRDTIRPALVRTLDEKREFGVEFEFANSTWVPGRAIAGEALHRVKKRGQETMRASLKPSKRDVFRAAIRGNPSFSFHTHPPVSEEELSKDGERRAAEVGDYGAWLGFTHSLPSVIDIKGALLKYAMGGVAFGVFSNYGATLLVANFDDYLAHTTLQGVADLKRSTGRGSGFRDVVKEADSSALDDWARVHVLTHLGAHVYPEMSVYYASATNQPKFTRVGVDSGPEIFYPKES